jgi:hypothetical protein
MKNRVRYKTFDQISFADMMVYSKLPLHSFWSNVETKIDFSFADSLCSVLYSGRGQHPYAPSLKLKIHLIQAYYNLSDRLAEEKIIGDLFIKRFLGLPVDFFGFDHSTIGLDRSRMGTAMFQACHLYILAQMHSLGLWGDKDEQWIIDSFPTNVAMARVGAYRLIQQGMIRIFQHLKRSHRDLFRLAEQSVIRDAMLFRMSSTSSTSEQILAFSKLVAQAYGLLQWFQLDDVALCFQAWPNKNAQQTSVELQAILKRILEENSRVVSPADNDSANSNDDQGDSGSTTVEYEKIPRKDRPKNQIISVTDPEARVSKKNYTTTRGYKTQNLCTTGGVVLDTKMIPAMEHDRDAMVEMVQGIQSFFRITPIAVLGDTAYGHGEQRVALASLGITTVAPVITTQNPTGLYDISRFYYDRENDVYRCPNNKTTVRKNHNTKIEGWQHFFAKKDCAGCPFRLECTTNKSRRSVFHSDYYELYETAKAYNASEHGKENHKLRYRVERKNQELKNDCGLGKAQTRSKKALSIKAKFAAMVVNLKHTVRRLFDPSPGFIRRICTT